MGWIPIPGAGGGGGTVQTAKVTRESTNQSIANATTTLISFDTEKWDTDSMADVAGANPERVTVQTAGKYRITAGYFFAANNTGIRLIQIRKNGTTVLAYNDVNAPASGSFGATITTEDDALANDYYEVQVHQSSGGALNLTADVRNFLSVTRIDP